MIFDDDNLVERWADPARNTRPASGLEALINTKVHLQDSSAGSRPGRKALTLVHSMIAGGDSINDADVLRAGSSATVLGTA